jgi:hypothetical protein
MENQKNYNLEIDEVIKNMCYIDIDTVIKDMCSIKEEPKEEPISFEENEYIPIEFIMKPFYKKMCECIEMIKSNKYILKQTKNILGLEIKKNVNFEKNTRNNCGLYYHQQAPKKVYNKKTRKYEETETYPLEVRGFDNMEIEKNNKGFSYSTIYIPYYHSLHNDCDKKKEATKEMIERVSKPYNERIKVSENQKDKLLQLKSEKQKELKEKIGNNNYDWSKLQNPWCWRMCSPEVKEIERKKLIEKCGFDVCIVINNEIDKLAKQIIQVCERINEITKDKDDCIMRSKRHYSKIQTDEYCIKKRVPVDKIDSWTQTSTHKWSPLNLKVWDKTGKTSNKGCTAYYIWKRVDIYGNIFNHKTKYDANVFDEEKEEYVGKYRHWTLDGIKIEELKEWCETSGMKMKEGRKTIKYTYGDLATFFLKY